MRRVRPQLRRPLVALVVLLVALAIGYGVKAADSGHSGSKSPAPTTTASGAAGSPTAPGSTARRTSPAATITAGPSAPAGAVALSSLPPQAAATVRLIEAGGPFPFPRNDGVVFHNAEHLLPREADGYYHEYTVPTPGAHDRGARRVITGRAGEYYYTGDHYDSFVRVDVSR